MNKKIGSICLMIILMCLVIAPLMPNVSASSKTTTRNISETHLNENLTGKTLLFLGDSITVGSGDTGTNRSNFPNRVTQQININNGYPSMVNSGLSGDTIVHVLTDMDARVHNHNPDYVHIAFGTNDMRCIFGNTAANPYGSISFEENLTALVEEIITENAGVVISLQSIPPIINYLQGSYAEHLMHNWAIRNVSDAFGLKYAPVYEQMEITGNTSYVATDNIHPNTIGSHKIANVVYEYAFSHYSGGITFSAPGEASYVHNGAYAKMEYEPYLPMWEYSNLTAYSANYNAGYFAGRGDLYDGEIGDYIEGNIYCSDSFRIRYATASGHGIVQIHLNDVLVDTVDTYSAVTTRRLYTDYYTVTTPGLQHVKITITDKNGSASGYAFLFDGVRANWSISQGNLRTTAITSPYTQSTATFSFTATQTDVKRYLSTNTTHTNVDPSVSGKEEEHYRGLTNSMAYVYHTGGGAVPEHSMNFTLYTKGIVVLYAIRTTTGTGYNVSLNGAYHGWFDNSNPAGTTYDAYYEIDVGATYDTHEILITKPTNTSIGYITAIEYTTPNYIVYYSHDGDNWTMLSGTSYTYTNGDDIYIDIDFFDTVDISNLKVVFGDETPTEMEKLFVTFSGFIPLIVVVGVVMVLTTHLGMGGKRR